MYLHKKNRGPGNFSFRPYPPLIKDHISEKASPKKKFGSPYFDHLRPLFSLFFTSKILYTTSSYTSPPHVLPTVRTNRPRPRPFCLVVVVQNGICLATFDFPFSPLEAEFSMQSFHLSVTGVIDVVKHTARRI